MPTSGQAGRPGPGHHEDRDDRLAGRSATAAMISRVTSSAQGRNGTMNTTVMASISSAAPSRRSDRPYCSALALATTSTGSRQPPGPASLSAAPPGCLPTVPAPAARPLRRPRRPGCPGRRRWSAPRPAVPAGAGCDDTTATMSNISSSVPVRITTAWWNSASTANSPASIVAVCEDAARRPAPVRPGLQGHDGQQQGADAGGLSLAPTKAIERGHRNGPTVARTAARWSASTCLVSNHDHAGSASDTFISPVVPGCHGTT